jgi:flavin reductase (DIM6/NTAB) family NADH-FMN oxidoreductase RutF
VLGLEEIEILNRLSDFKDAMSQIPSSVSVVGAFANDLQSEIVAATISSLVSVSVNPESEEVLFALKNKSFLGNHLLDSPLCSISVLNNRQHEVAYFFGSRTSALQPQEGLVEKIWNRSGNFPYINEASVVLLCKIREKIERSHSTIYFASVIEFFCDDIQKPLVYFDRKFNSIYEPPG